MADVMDIEAIMKVLPHRYPFLLVDRVTECDFQRHIVGFKNITITEPHFQGHFPHHPIMPGVLQLEALAQLAGILLNQLAQREGAVAYLTTADEVKFRRMVVPGDQLRLEINILRARSKVAEVEGFSSVGDLRACQAIMKFAYAD
jgi:beta-hydroxyacyl-ACP dehydratase FabZ